MKNWYRDKLSYTRHERGRVEGAWVEPVRYGPSAVSLAIENLDPFQTAPNASLALTGSNAAFFNPTAPLWTGPEDL